MYRPKWVVQDSNICHADLQNVVQVITDIVCAVLGCRSILYGFHTECAHVGLRQATGSRPVQGAVLHVTSLQPHKTSRNVAPGGSLLSVLFQLVEVHVSVKVIKISLLAGLSNIIDDVFVTSMLLVHEKGLIEMIFRRDVSSI